MGAPSPLGAPVVPGMPQSGLSVGNKALGPPALLPPPGGPLLAKPQFAALGSDQMTVSRGAPFQVSPIRQAPGQVMAPKPFAKGGHVKALAVRMRG